LCGNLDDLAKKFLNNVSPQIKRNEIAQWWAKGWPVSGDYLNSLFGRGMFFEKLLLNAPVLKGFKATSHSFPLYDFYTTTGTKIAASMKTTRFTDVNNWLNYVDKNGNKKMLDHLNDLNKGLKKSLDGTTVGGAGYKVQMIIVMPRYNNFQATKTAWLSSLSNQFKNVEFKIITVEDQFNL
jgi:abortive infection bacteriophage resistance protein